MSEYERYVVILTLKDKRVFGPFAFDRCETVREVLKDVGADAEIVRCEQYQDMKDFALVLDLLRGL